MTRITVVPAKKMAAILRNPKYATALVTVQSSGNGSPGCAGVSGSLSWGRGLG